MSADLPVIAYKGFNQDLTCRGFQYAEGETYEQAEAAKLCSTGFHACLEPLDVLRYYSPATSTFHRVTLGDDAQRDEREDSKVASRTIKIGVKVSLDGMVKAHRVGSKSGGVRIKPAVLYTLTGGKVTEVL